MKRPQIVGILNLTPDSFSGDGSMELYEAIDRFSRLSNDGADVIDIGAESTRPGATPLQSDEEWARLGTVLREVMPQEPIARVSVDTYHPATAVKAIALGVHIINDVSGLSSAEMCRVLADSNCHIVVMHSLSVPANKNITLPPNTDPLLLIQHWQNQVLERAENFGIVRSRLIFDPGIGFGKTPRQSLSLIMNARELLESGDRWMIGHSRKSFLKLFGDLSLKQKDKLTLALSALMTEGGVDYLRVHDVKAHMHMVDALCA